MAKRNTRWYRKNEAEVMRKLGLTPTKNSGAGWIEKEDGQNEYLIAQLKSTDADSISIKLRDIEILESNAQTSHKVPCFVIQFIKSGDVYIMARPSDLKEVTSYITSGVCHRPTGEVEIKGDIIPHPKVKKIQTSSTARNDFWEDKSKGEEKWKRKWK
jgi:hypothetical protein